MEAEEKGVFEVVVSAIDWDETPNVCVRERRERRKRERRRYVKKREREREKLKGVS